MANQQAQLRIQKLVEENEQLKNALAQASQQRGLLTPQEVVASLTLRRAVGEDETFGRCSHALQILPNQVILLLVTEETEGGSHKVSTFYLGEEVPGFSVEKTMIETLDGPA